MQLGKKGVIGQITAMIVPLVTVGIVLVVGFLIMSSAGDQAAQQLGNSTLAQCLQSGADGSGGSAACNATGTTINAISTVPNWLPIIIITVIGALMISLVSMFRGRK